MKQKNGDPVKLESNLSWLPLPNRISWHLSSDSPPTGLVTSVFVLAFDGERLLMFQHVRRGADVPGGHVEKGESPEEAALREVKEETGRLVHSLRPLGFQHMELLGQKPEGYRYPYPESYLQFFTGELDESGARAELAEDSAGALLVSPPAVVRLPWHERHAAFYSAALSRARASRS